MVSYCSNIKPYMREYSSADKQALYALQISRLKNNQNVFYKDIQKAK